MQGLDFFLLQTDVCYCKELGFSFLSRQQGDPLDLSFVIFDFFAPWYRRSGEASSLKIS